MIQMTRTQRERSWDAVLDECTCPSPATLDATCSVHAVGSRKYRDVTEANHWSDMRLSAFGER